MHCNYSDNKSTSTIHQGQTKLNARMFRAENKATQENRKNGDWYQEPKEQNSLFKALTLDEACEVPYGFHVQLMSDTTN